MTGTEFCAFLAAHDLTEIRAAALFGVDRATVQRWKIRKHVPGPWSVRYATNITAIITPKGEMQLSLHGIYDGLNALSIDFNEWQANAKLIAAAPDLLAAVRDCRRLLASGERVDDAVIEQIDEIIKRATGE
jgi:hypothetical protein